MARNVNAQSSAYDKLDQLEAIHSKVIAEMEKEIKDTRNLIGVNNGFYSEETCKKINTLLTAVEKQVLPTLKKSFQISEKTVKLMEQAIISNDRF